MEKAANFDLGAAHRLFSARCFNLAWEFIDQGERTQAETDQMLHAAHASAWHWSQRSDATNANLSISLWQLSRAYALAGEAGISGRYARRCLEVSQTESPFLLGYACEALARAAGLAGDRAAAAAYLKRGRDLLPQVEDPEDRQLLEKDLASLAE